MLTLAEVQIIITIISSEISSLTVSSSIFLAQQVQVCKSLLLNHQWQFQSLVQFGVSVPGCHKWLNSLITVCSCNLVQWSTVRQSQRRPFWKRQSWLYCDEPFPILLFSWCPRHKGKLANKLWDLNQYAQGSKVKYERI